LKEKSGDVAGDIAFKNENEPPRLTLIFMIIKEKREGFAGEVST